MSSSSLTLYDVSIPPMIRGLQNLSTILDKAVDHDKSLATTLPSTRLVDDMLPFTFQIQTMCNIAKAVAPRVLGVEATSVKDEETTMEQLKERIASTIKLLQEVPKEGWEGAEEKECVIPRKDGEMKMSGLDLVNRFVLPNFYFHETMAYALIRQKGVQIGKMDFLGKITE